MLQKMARHTQQVKQQQDKLNQQRRQKASLFGESRDQQESDDSSLSHIISCLLDFVWKANSGLLALRKFSLISCTLFRLNAVHVYM